MNGKTRIVILGVASAILVLIAALWVAHNNASKPAPTSTGTVITVHEGETVDAHHGDQLNVIMNQTGDPAGRCATMGGRYESPVCVDVDF